MNLRETFNTTRDNYGDHFGGLLTQRNPGPESSGSVFDAPQSAESLGAAEWTPYEHDAVQAPARAFRAPIAGKVGLVALASLPADETVRLVDGHETGFVSVVADGVASQPVDFTVALVGPGDNGEDIIWTVHPGDPIRPSSLEATDETSGKTLTAAEAIRLGFGFAKVGGA